MFESILCQIGEYDSAILESLIELAVEIAREGREGRRIGTLFTLGDEQTVLAKSKLLILDPLVGHPESPRHVSNPNLRGTVKELAQLDGAFLVSREGIVLSLFISDTIFCKSLCFAPFATEKWSRSSDSDLYRSAATAQGAALQ